MGREGRAMRKRYLAAAPVGLVLRSGPGQSVVLALVCCVVGVFLYGLLFRGGLFVRRGSGGFSVRFGRGEAHFPRSRGRPRHGSRSVGGEADRNGCRERRQGRH